MGDTSNNLAKKVPPKCYGSVGCLQGETKASENGCECYHHRWFHEIVIAGNIEINLDRPGRWAPGNQKYWKDDNWSYVRVISGSASFRWTVICSETSTFDSSDSHGQRSRCNIGMWHIPISWLCKYSPSVSSTIGKLLPTSETSLRKIRLARRFQAIPWRYESHSSIIPRTRTSQMVGRRVIGELELKATVKVGWKGKIRRWVTNQSQIGNFRHFVRYEIT